MTWLNGPLLGFDLETTGTDPYTCHAVDMALVLNDPEEKDILSWEWLINPGVDIPLNATAIHGISTEQVVEKGVSPDKAVSELAAVLDMINTAYGGIPPVCIYNAGYDIPIVIRMSGGKVGINWTVLDPMVIDKELDKYRPGKRTLTSVSAAHKLGVTNAHRAVGDCMSTTRLMRAIGRKYPRLAESDPVSIHEMEVTAYKEQMEQFINYRRVNGDAEFNVNTEWPYSDDIFIKMRDENLC